MAWQSKHLGSEEMMEELIEDILHQMQRKLGPAQLKELRRVLVGTLSNRSNKEGREETRGLEGEFLVAKETEGRSQRTLL